MPRSRKPPSPTGVHYALDEARFGAQRTLNLRSSLPTSAEAKRRAESWLRQQQADNVREVLIVTGRGNNSDGGVSVVRAAVLSLLHSLKRRGVIAAHGEHTAGSFVVTLAPLRSLVDAPRRRREKPPAVLPVTSKKLELVTAETRRLLRDLAQRALEDLGVQVTEPFLEGEMLKQLTAIGRSVTEGPGREQRLRAALRVALAQRD
jgi:hypothetical protein